MTPQQWALWIFLFAMLFGGGATTFVRERFEARERRRVAKEEAARRAIEGPDPICGCGHHHAYHDPREGDCRQFVKTAVEWGEDIYGDESVTRWEAKKCPCARYSGPEPMAQVYLPEISPTAEFIPIDPKKEK